MRVGLKIKLNAFAVAFALFVKSDKDRPETCPNCPDFLIQFGIEVGDIHNQLAVE